MLKLMSYCRSIGLPRVSAVRTKKPSSSRWFAGLKVSGTLSVIVASPSQSLYQLPVKRSPPDLTLMFSTAPPAKLSASAPAPPTWNSSNAAEVEVAGVGVGAFGRVDAFESGLVLLVDAVGADSRSGCRCASRRRRTRHLHARAPAPSPPRCRARSGISVSSSLVKLVPTSVVDVSTTGDSPVTVTVSCSVATCSC